MKRTHDFVDRFTATIVVEVNLSTRFNLLVDSSTIELVEGRSLHLRPRSSTNEIKTYWRSWRWSHLFPGTNIIVF